ncbi:MAG: NTP transferase domain-containing protein [Rhodospirillaceae bacterium]|jgi:UDP-N-acetylglucosamine diphosphorylase / glucose-1-phosphate thymidylyltransferase / UDP-N-acetylgalactosamine diphosphorylase / glucosamine-1-phosphate N-acetyltransferase / galactosamine-1-phosphate N-acetyltransferase|nr:NTP transferase domain-containing protein [Rhodospirillaceae bacterium]MBT7771667.1 NTP transferase domain-containing protein [Rhodospirillales bacterium]MBT4702469.1 NTP transferase domain-containing protein [Rhodospirillaceae bacterium]MBT5034812.1 NTP transferase domain-containing protein [Rhodospirillaceae bacterium]MBT6218533.1 NTP transferase domain-containing protein [Rhodospirillaceae bacterium]
MNSQNLSGVILAAGKGTRAYPYTQRIPKAMLDICGRPLIQFSLELMRDKLGIKDIVIVVSEKNGMIEQRFGDGHDLGLNICYRVNDAVEKGPVYSLSLAESKISAERFVVMLSDEIYLDSNHEAILGTDYRDEDILVTARPNSLIRDISKNFSIDFVDGRISRLIEKPTSSENGLLGCGTYVFRRDVFDQIREEFRTPGPATDNLTAFIANRLVNGAKVGYVPLGGNYINVNYHHDVNRARSMARTAMFADPKVSLIMPCLSDSAGFEDVVRTSIDAGRVDEVLLVVHEHTKEFDRVASKYGARLIVAKSESRGLAPLIRTGVRESTGDIIAVMAADGTFEIGDLDKLLAYIYDAEMVVGTRTARQLIDQGSNMDIVARLSNYFLAKFIEALWVTHLVRLSDVGCVWRVFWRYSYDAVIDRVDAERGEFLIDMVIEMLLYRFQLIELPVRYCISIDEQAVRFRERNLATFFRIIKLALSKRLKTL